MKKVALLDTDFISKAHRISISEGDRLIDRVMELPEYNFYCHEQTKIELARHDSEAPSWLEKQIQSGIVAEYTDECIIKEMVDLYFRAGISQYTSFLKNACSAFNRNYFTDHYGELDELNLFQVSEQDYCRTLFKLDAQIGEGNNLGEIKAYVVLQWLNTLNDSPVSYFCSDDRNARNGVVSVEGISVKCISIASAYQRLMSEGVLQADSIKSYMDAAVKYYKAQGHDNIRVIEASQIGRHMRVPCEQVFNEILEGHFIELNNGMLKYRN